MGRLCAVIALIAGLGYAISLDARRNGSDQSGGGYLVVKPDVLHWQPMPREWVDGPPPATQGPLAGGGTEVAILQGDPTKDGAPFVIRLRSMPGTKLPPHYHLVDENVTVLSGTVCIGMGDKLDENACQDMPAGSYFVMPKGMHHFVVAKGDVVQLHGVGPFKIYWVR